MRDNRIDSLKGFLIVLVVLGHLLRECCDLNGFNLNMTIYIYSFHMPLFILISGFFTRVKSDKKLFWGGVKKLIS